MVAALVSPAIAVAVMQANDAVIGAFVVVGDLPVAEEHEAVASTTATRPTDRRFIGRAYGRALT
jgi:hypothetical protein